MDVFRKFLEAGQSDVESYRSAARVFRGGDVHGKVCFTKDGAYLEGVILIYCFIRRALQEGRSEVLRMSTRSGGPGTHSVPARHAAC